jgi:hypothetical protein
VFFSGGLVDGLEDIELASISQKVMGRFYNTERRSSPISAVVFAANHQ